MLKTYPLAVIFISLTVLCGIGHADSSFDFAQRGHGNLGSSVVFTSGASSVQAYGFRWNGRAANLFFNGAGDESGLGIAAGRRHDVSLGYFVQFTGKGISSVTIEAAGPGGSWAIFGSNALGQRGVLLARGSGDSVINLSTIANGYSYISVSGRGRGSVLLQGMAAVAPEPSSPALMLAAGLFGLAEIGRRRLMA